MDDIEFMRSIFSFSISGFIFMVASVVLHSSYALNFFLYIIIAAKCGNCAENWVSKPVIVIHWSDMIYFNPGSLSFLASAFSLLCGCILCGIGYILCNLSISFIRKTKVTQG